MAFYLNSLNSHVRYWPYTDLPPSPRLPLRRVAGEGDAVQDAFVAVVVVDRVVQGAAIVPQRDRARLPAEAAGEFGLCLMLEQVIQQRRAFRLGPALEIGRMGEADIKRLAPGFRMNADDRMFGDLGLGDVFLRRVGDPRGAGVRDPFLVGTEHPGQRRQ